MMRTVAAFLVAALLAPAAAAQTLPAFPLTAPNGAAVESAAALSAPGQWLLAYVVPGSGPSDRLVQALGERWTADPAVRVILIVSGPVDTAKAYLAAKGGETFAAGARWYADTEGAAWSALKFQGTLAIAGMTGTLIQWKIDGVIADPDVLQPAVNKWLGGTAEYVRRNYVDRRPRSRFDLTTN